MKLDFNPSDITNFTCNVCGSNNSLLVSEFHRELAVCRCCGSNARFRGVIRALSLSIFNKSLCLKDFPSNKKIKGIGMSDGFYAELLSEKFSYENTFYNREPKLDILNSYDIEKFKDLDFVISTDVFEHIFQPINNAFLNVFKMLKKGGCFIFSVPYMNANNSLEHFPELHDFFVTDFKGTQVLINRRRDGKLEIHEDLIFHGGDGATLELRVFGKLELVKLIKEVGFSEVVIHEDPDLSIGYYWKPIPDAYNRRSLSDYLFEGYIFTIIK
jgi:SAM-dependent methyltransferase